jgi:outer membrane receptor protein involved in Fe transport
MQCEDRVNGFSYTNNVGTTEITGLEFDVTYTPIDGLNLGLGGNF